MTETMQKLIAQIEKMSPEDQEAIASSILEDVGRIDELRAELDPALQQLDEGKFVEFKPGMFLEAFQNLETHIKHN